MSTTPKPSKPATQRPAAGVPLGGVGAGSLELGPDGWLRRLRINNNRSPETELPCAEHTFLALRVAQGDATYARVLQVAPPLGPEARHAAAPPYLAPKALGSRALYPVANFSLMDPAAPIRAVWSAFSPVIPFDYDASILPLVLFGIRCENNSQQAASVSLMLNLESFCGRTASHATASAGPGGALTALEAEVKTVVIQAGRRSHLEESETDEIPRQNAVEMGSPTELPTNAHGHYCVAGRPGPGMGVSVLPWDLGHADDEATLWAHFLGQGNLDGAKSASSHVNAGAVCLQFLLEPGEVRRADFAFSWYCPRFLVNGVDLGVGYANRLANAAEVAKLGLRNIDYYYASVEGWRGRMKASTLPRWLNDHLINSCHVLSTNSLYTRDGSFGLIEGAEDRRTTLLHLRRYTSLGALLFFPRFEDNALLAFANAEDLLLEKRFPAHLGEACLNQPDFRDVDGLQVDLACEFVLSAYRNYCLTGNLARLRALVPRLQEAMVLAAGRDNDGDGLPEVGPLPKTYDGIALHGLNSLSCGLWLATLRAYARLVTVMRIPEEGARYLALAKKAEKSFERYFWDESYSHYRLSWDPRVGADAQHPESRICHSAQLSGQWIADFLALGALHDRSRIARALATIADLNERDHGLLSAVLPDGSPYQNPDHSITAGHVYWPTHTAAHYACLQIQRGQVEAGMRVLAKSHQSLIQQQRRDYDQPNAWTPVPGAGTSELLVNRFAGALSIWYVLYALTGLELNIPEKRIRIMPRLPQGTQSMETLLFTPACLGWLRYQEDLAPGYRQRLQLSLDSPITLQIIELRLPLNMQKVTVRCEVPDGAFECSHQLEPDTGAQRLVISAARPVIANSALSVEVNAV